MLSKVRGCSRLSQAVLKASFSSNADFSPQESLTKSMGRIITESPISHGKGSYLYLENGKKLLDFTCGIAVTNTGHCHPRVVQAAQEQVGKIIHAQVNVAYSRPMLDLVSRLKKIVPAELKNGFFFANSGAEAVENAVKIARLYTKKPNIVCLQHSFHGRTFGALALTTSKSCYRAGVSPLMGGVYPIAAPYCCHCDSPRNGRLCCGKTAHELEHLLLSQSAPSETAALIMEPILGEGGYVVPQPAVFKELQRICKKHNILFIADEVQSGFGRTGKYFAFEHMTETAPDILIMAKGIASGFPLSALAVRKEILDSAPPGSIGGTYGGNPVSCAAASATIDVLNEEKLLENATHRGKELRGAMENLQKKYPDHILEIRGLGLMNAVEFKQRPGQASIAAALSKECAVSGLLLMPTGLYDTIRFMPPLTVSKEEMQEGLDIFKAAFEKVVKGA